MNRKIRKLGIILRTGNYGFLWKPKTVQIITNLSCNFNCRMCHQKDIRAKLEPEMSLKEIRVLLENFKKEGVHQISFIGGEFFIDKERAFKILDMAEEMYFMFAIGTNGFTLKEEDVNKLNLYWGLTEIDLSIDGIEETHDYIRGVRGAFSKAKQVLKWCEEYEIPIMTVTVVQKDNLKELSSLIALFKNYSVARATFVYEYSITKNELELSKNILKNIVHKDVDIFASYSVNDTCFDYSYTELKSSINKMKDHAKEINQEINVFDLEKGDNNVFEYIYDKTLRDTHHLSCDSAGCIGQIDWTGYPSVCPFIRVNDLECGHATGLMGKNYLKNQEVLDIQEKIKDMNMLPICTRCCGLNIGEHK